METLQAAGLGSNELGSLVGKSREADQQSILSFFPTKKAPSNRGGSVTKDDDDVVIIDDSNTIARQESDPLDQAFQDESLLDQFFEDTE